MSRGRITIEFLYDDASLRRRLGDEDAEPDTIREVAGRLVDHLLEYGVDRAGVAEAAHDDGD